MNTNIITANDLNTLATNLSAPPAGVEYFTINPMNENGYIIINASYNDIINAINQEKLPIFKSQGDDGISYSLIISIENSLEDNNACFLELANFSNNFWANSPNENFSWVS